MKFSGEFGVYRSADLIEGLAFLMKPYNKPSLSLAYDAVPSHPLRLEARQE